ncbi:MAG: hypothetical protein ACOYIE_00880 [Agathobaculum sp.]|jgi:hypothetical protein|uniref:hypothetical protein n=1 Tax=Agathobaculum sp. TaxID=2048138 RepID=UPI003D8D2B57
MSNRSNNSYYQRYRGAAIRFQVIGGILLAAGIGANFLFDSSMLVVSLIFAGPGAFLLITGGSSMRPHNLVKAFAQQCIREPSREMAQGLLDALTQQKSVRLLNNSLQLVHNAVAVYEQTEDADPQLVQQLHEAAEERIVKKVF